MQTITLAPRAAGQTIFAVGTRLELVGRVRDAGPLDPTPSQARRLREERAEWGDLITVRDPGTGRRADVWTDEVLIVLTETPCGRCRLPSVDVDERTNLCGPCDLHDSDDDGSIFDGTDRALLDAAGPVATTAAGLATDLVDDDEDEPNTFALRARFTSTYSDGDEHERTETVEVRFPAEDEDEDDWASEVLTEFTGSGRNDGTDALYEVAVLSCEDMPGLVGRTFEFGL